jgi:hypothetical protein
LLEVDAITVALTADKAGPDILSMKTEKNKWWSHKESIGRSLSKREKMAHWTQKITSRGV